VGAGFALVVRQTPPICLSVVAAPSQAEAPTPQACLDVPKPSDAGFPVQVHQIRDAMYGSIQGIVSEAKLVSNSASQEVFLFPWEEDLPASPWEEAHGFGVTDIVVALVSEVLPVKASYCPSKTPNLIQRGFFGLRAASSSPSGVKEASLSTKGKDPCSEKALPIPSSLLEKSVLSLGVVEVGLIPHVSKSQVVYARRVKDEVSKQLQKNKELLAKVMADIPTEGYSKEVIHTMNFALVVGLSWGGDDKRMLNLLFGIEKEKQELYSS
jgi:hypothetical protein